MKTAAVLVASVLACVAPSAALGDMVSMTVTPSQPNGTNGWYRSNVSVTFTVNPPATSASGDCDVGGPVTWQQTVETSNTMRSCEATDGVNIDKKGITIRLDKTPPSATGVTFNRPPDANGWFNHPVRASWSGRDGGPSGLASCTATDYAGPDSGTAALTGTCRDVAGWVSAPLGVGFKYDATAPVVTGAAAAHPPKGNGWYTAPIALAWAGQDATSGLASCTSLTYSGPDGAGNAPAGTCTDQAGNVSAPAPFALNYDATPPQLRVAADTGNREVKISWRAIGAQQITVTRVRLHVRKPHRRVVYRGAGGVVLDRGLKNRKRYAYTVRAVDVAGNHTTRTVRVRPSSNQSIDRLIRPGRGATLTKPPMLRWFAVRRASYYNIQLLREGKKILSVWPRRPHYQLRSEWRYGGHRVHLAKGTYVWYVWGGYGRRSEHRYGKVLGKRSFKIT